MYQKGESAMTEVFAYLRVSGKSQVRGDGFRRQFIAIRQYCAAHQLHIVRIFKERGVSGTKELDDRPALSELFAALEEDGIKSVVVEKLDRMARDLMVQETIMADMQKHGYTLLSTAEPDLCSRDPSRVLIRQIFGALAQWERAMIVMKLRGARQRKKARGERGEGRHAYGEKPGEEVVLQRILALQSTGHSTRAIANFLNTAGDATRMGKPWQPGTVAKILTRCQSKSEKH
jgi:DNA invertase Pin-like site-specific DNA recombinase